MPNGGRDWGNIGHGLGMTSPGIIDTLTGLGIIASGHPGVRRRAECRPGKLTTEGYLTWKSKEICRGFGSPGNSGEGLDTGAGSLQNVVSGCRVWLHLVTELMAQAHTGSKKNATGESRGCTGPCMGIMSVSVRQLRAALRPQKMPMRTGRRRCGGMRRRGTGKRTSLRSHNLPGEYDGILAGEFNT